MLMDAAKLSQIIREKKKKLLEESPEVGTSEPASLNAQDVYEKQEAGRIESTLESPHKIDARDMDINENVGVTPEEKSRMVRLREFIGKLKI